MSDRARRFVWQRRDLKIDKSKVKREPATNEEIEPNVMSDSRCESAREEARRLLDSQFETSDQPSTNCLRKAFGIVVNAFDVILKHSAETGDPIMTNAEMIKKLVADGRFGLTADELKPLSDSALTKLIAQVDGEDEDEEEMPAENAETPPEPAQNTEEPPATNAQELPEPLQRIVDVLNTPEKMEMLQALLTSNQQASTEEHTKLVTDLVANSACRFTKERLEEMPVEDLRALAQSLITPNYSGQGDPVITAQGHEYALPAML